MPDQSQVQLTQRIIENRTAIYGFILAHVADTNAAEDIFQDVCVVLCERFASYDPARPFRHWAMGIAHKKVLQHYKAHRKDSCLLLDPSLAEKVLASDAWDEPEGAERGALRECLKKLSDKVRRMVSLKYAENLKPAAIAERVGWKARAVSVALSRARSALTQCIDGKLGIGTEVGES